VKHYIFFTTITHQYIKKLKSLQMTPNPYRQFGHS